ncbi:MAG TPA: hypothetical protein VMS08_04090, partial [Candidatus Saccharimonadia bacterium]|nr:hypothetical protein [Candidatus Saccharimonadia bacterium]
NLKKVTSLSAMLEPVIVAAVTFILTFVTLRAVEWLYHKIRRSKDWSPHWGSWLFAILFALFALISSLGR